MSYRNYRLRNTCLCKCLKSHISVHPRSVNMLKGPKKGSNLHDSSFISFVYHSGKISVGKKSFLVISEILRPLVDTFTSDEKYFLGKRENLQQPIEIQLSTNLKIFSENSTRILKSKFDFKHLEYEDESHSLRLSVIIDCKIRASVNV